MLQRFRSITQSLGLPSICTLCNQFHSGRLAVCVFCRELLGTLGTACQQCAEPLADPNFPICGICIKNPPAFDNAYIEFSFEEPLRSLIHRFKYQEALFIGSFLAQLMRESLDKMREKPECLIPVPMHQKKLRQRGFNQAVILAQLLSKHTGIPCDWLSCRKTIHTVAQADLNKDQRQKNVRNVFSVKTLPYRHVALVDDLLTTGSTANELALTLKRSGIEQVDIWCCARRVL